jgi:hypothetical protein
VLEVVETLSYKCYDAKPWIAYLSPDQNLIPAAYCRYGWYIVLSLSLVATRLSSHPLPQRMKITRLL